MATDQSPPHRYSIWRDVGTNRWEVVKWTDRKPEVVADYKTQLEAKGKAAALMILERIAS